MNKVELSKQLQSMGISPNKYSLEGSVATWDTIVLVKNYEYLESSIYRRTW